MKIELDRNDLLPEFRELNTSQTEFNHFKMEVRQVIRIAGRAVFFDDDRRTYNAIISPELKAKKEKLSAK